jgi:hypothetical protein
VTTPIYSGGAAAVDSLGRIRDSGTRTVGFGARSVTSAARSRRRTPRPDAAGGTPRPHRGRPAERLLFAGPLEDSFSLASGGFVQSRTNSQPSLPSAKRKRGATRFTVIGTIHADAAVRLWLKDANAILPLHSWSPFVGDVATSPSTPSTPRASRSGDGAPCGLSREGGATARR